MENNLFLTREFEFCKYNLLQKELLNGKLNFLRSGFNFEGLNPISLYFLHHPFLC